MDILTEQQESCLQEVFKNFEKITIHQKEIRQLSSHPSERQSPHGTPRGTASEFSPTLAMNEGLQKPDTQ